MTSFETGSKENLFQKQKEKAPSRAEQLFNCLTGLGLIDNEMNIT